MFARQKDTLARCNGWHAAQDYEHLQLPEAERVCRDGVWLNHTVFLGDRSDVDDIIEALKKVQRLASGVPVSQAVGKL
jgi:hypothetical protein